MDGLSIAPDGNSLASASWDGTVKLWDVSSGQLHITLTGHTDRVGRVAWSPDGNFVGSCSVDQTLWLWDVAADRYRGALHGQTAVVVGLAFTPDSSRVLISGGEASCAGGTCTAASCFGCATRIRGPLSRSDEVPMEQSWPVSVTMGLLYSGILRAEIIFEHCEGIARTSDSISLASKD